MIPSFFSLVQSRQIWLRLISNFFIWLIPGLFALVFFLIILLISIEGGDGSLLGIELNRPKGLMSFVSIGLIATSVLTFNCLWYFAPIDLEGAIEIGFLGIVILFFGILFFYAELKRIYCTIKK